MFELADQNEIELFITSTTVTDIYYITKKEKGHKISLEFINDLLEIVEVLGVDKNIIINAIKSKISDFEDAIQVESASQNDIEIIITRNKKDFKNSKIPVYIPDDLIASMK